MFLHLRIALRHMINDAGRRIDRWSIQWLSTGASAERSLSMCPMTLIVPAPALPVTQTAITNHHLCYMFLLAFLQTLNLIITQRHYSPVCSFSSAACWMCISLVDGVCNCSSNDSYDNVFLSCTLRWLSTLLK